MADIKIRKVDKGGIKSLDRVASITSRVKDVQTKTKSLAEDSRTQGRSSVNEYASDNVTAASRDISREAVYWTVNVSRYAAQKTYQVVSGRTQAGNILTRESVISIKQKKEMFSKRSINSIWTSSSPSRKEPSPNILIMGKEPFERIFEHLLTKDSSAEPRRGRRR